MRALRACNWDTQMSVRRSGRQYTWNVAILPRWRRAPSPPRAPPAAVTLPVARREKLQVVLRVRREISSLALCPFQRRQSSCRSLERKPSKPAVATAQQRSRGHLLLVCPEALRCVEELHIPPGCGRSQKHILGLEGVGNEAARGGSIQPVEVAQELDTYGTATTTTPGSGRKAHPWP